MLTADDITTHRARAPGLLARADAALVEARDTIVYLLAAGAHEALADEALSRAKTVLDTIRATRRDITI